MSRMVHIQEDMRGHTTQKAVWERKEEEYVETREYEGPYRSKQQKTRAVSLSEAEEVVVGIEL
jgi:hypothetical protein